MAKNIKLVQAQTDLAQAQARVKELETQIESMIQKSSDEMEKLRAKVTELEGTVKKVTRYLKAALVFIRKEYVKTLSSEQLATQAGVIIVECLKHIEEKAGSVKCEKCEGHGVVDIRGTWMVCYDCIYGRALGHPGQKHVIDVVVSEMHREEQKNRFASQRPQNWDVSQEAKKAAEAPKVEKGSTTDITL